MLRTIILYAVGCTVGYSLLALAIRGWLRHEPDDVIQDLITMNTARPRDGMGTVDRNLANLAGKRRSDQALAAQENCRQAERLNHRIKSRSEKPRAFQRAS